MLIESPVGFPAEHALEQDYVVRVWCRRFVVYIWVDLLPFFLVKRAWEGNLKQSLLDDLLIGLLDGSFRCRRWSSLTGLFGTATWTLSPCSTPWSYFALTYSLLLWNFLCLLIRFHGLLLLPPLLSFFLWLFVFDVHHLAMPLLYVCRNMWFEYFFLRVIYVVNVEQWCSSVWIGSSLMLNTFRRYSQIDVTRVRGLI